MFCNLVLRSPFENLNFLRSFFCGPPAKKQFPVVGASGLTPYFIRAARKNKYSSLKMTHGSGDEPRLLTIFVPWLPPHGKIWWDAHTFDLVLPQSIQKGELALGLVYT